MIVALSGVGEQGISGDIAVRPCLIGASPAISQSVDAENIAESDDRLSLVEEPATVESELPGFCDYYVIGQFRLGIESVGNGLITGDDILDDQSIRNIHHVEAASLTSHGIIPLDDIPFDDRGSSRKHVDAASIRTHVVGDHIVEDLYRRSPPNADSTTTSSATEIVAVADDGV